MEKHITGIEMTKAAKEKADCEIVELQKQKEKDYICVCSRCEEVKVLTNLILNSWSLPTHWVCDEHYAEQMEELDKLREHYKHLNWLA